MHYRWFAKDENKTDDFGMPKSRLPEEAEPPKKPRYFSRTVLTGMLLSIVLIGWSIVEGDMPILFVAVAFILNGLRPFTRLLDDRVGAFVSNLLFGFSTALFLGAIIMAFI